jgi:hypothetical protein
MSEQDENKKPSEWEKRELGAFWKRKGKESGKTYLSGSVDGKEVVVFPNRRKQEGSKQPDYVVYESTPKKDQAPAPDKKKKEDDDLFD